MNAKTAGFLTIVTGVLIAIGLGPLASVLSLIRHALRVFF